MSKTEYQKMWIRANRDRINALARKRYTTDGRWEKQLWDRFKIYPEVYWEMYVRQRGVCKICKNPQMVGTKLDVDHDHATGKIRGLLCRHCNTGIGLLRDSANLLFEALIYILK